MNWGKKLVITLVLFMVFILSMAVVMFMRHDNDALIDKDYYEKGQLFDKDYNAKKAAVDDGINPTLITTNGLIITFPVSVKYELTCKRLSDYRMDRNFKGQTTEDRSIKIPPGELKSGPWLIRIQYSAENKNYLFEGEIVMP